ncbi:MAG TPA: glycosyl hydrolase [Arachidicoccus soli]|nr:glycosyl hydrolase [Arachidicoccus soli]
MTKSKATTFSCNLKESGEAFPHFWEEIVGSAHASMALRADWQKQLQLCHKELGFKRIRFHGILSDDMYTYVSNNPQDANAQRIFSFFNANQICDFLLSIGMKPFMELSFMPTAISSGNDTVFSYHGNINPPKKYSDWRTVIKTFITHLKDRYGEEEVRKWFFEVWNEPNLQSFWRGTQEEYFKLYQTTASAIKSVSKSFRVGGPATADNQWISAFVKFCRTEKIPLDFISTHHYPTDAFGKPGDDTITQLSESKRSVLHEEARKVKKQAKALPVYYTEWCTSSNPFDELHDRPYAAAFIIKTVMEARNLVEGYSYWTFSDIFSENFLCSIPFHGGFGLMNIYGIPKPSYRAFELLHHLGEEFLKVSGKHDTVDVWIIRKEKIINVLATNWALPKHKINNETITIHLKNISKISNAYIQKIDSNHSNPRKIWEENGSKDYLNEIEIKDLIVASRLQEESIQFKTNLQAAYYTLSLPAQSSACITIELKDERK